jgi:hypothetical protein
MIYFSLSRAGGAACYFVPKVLHADCAGAGFHRAGACAVPVAGHLVAPGPGFLD